MDRKIGYRPTPRHKKYPPTPPQRSCLFLRHLCEVLLAVSVLPIEASLPASSSASATGGPAVCDIYMSFYRSYAVLIILAFSYGGALFYPTLVYRGMLFFCFIILHSTITDHGKCIYTGILTPLSRRQVESARPAIHLEMFDIHRKRHKKEQKKLSAPKEEKKPRSPRPPVRLPILAPCSCRFAAASPHTNHLAWTRRSLLFSLS